MGDVEGDRCQGEQPGQRPRVAASGSGPLGGQHGQQRHVRAIPRGLDRLLTVIHGHLRRLDLRPFVMVRDSTNGKDGVARSSLVLGPRPPILPPIAYANGAPVLRDRWSGTLRAAQGPVHA